LKNKIKVILLAGAMVLLMLGSTVSASNGSLTFTHGVRNKILYGNIKSTKVEKSMGMIHDITFSDGSTRTVGCKVCVYSTKSYTSTYDASGKSGEFSLTYYVGGSYAGRSKQPWVFDF